MRQDTLNKVPLTPGRPCPWNTQPDAVVKREVVVTGKVKHYT